MSRATCWNFGSDSWLGSSVFYFVPPGAGMPEITSSPCVLCLAARAGHLPLSLSAGLCMASLGFFTCGSWPPDHPISHVVGASPKMNILRGLGGMSLQIICASPKLSLQIVLLDKRVPGPARTQSELPRLHPSVRGVAKNVWPASM